MEKKTYDVPEMEYHKCGESAILASGNDALGWDKDVIGNDYIDWFGGNV